MDLCLIRSADIEQCCAPPGGRRREVAVAPVRGLEGAALFDLLETTHLGIETAQTEVIRLSPLLILLLLIGGLPQGIPEKADFRNCHLWRCSSSSQQVAFVVNFPHIEDCKLVLSDCESLIRHYDKTLKAWLARFLSNKERVKYLFDKQFVRLFEYYLASCAAAFTYSDLLVYQLQIVKNYSALPSNRRDYIYQ